MEHASPPAAGDRPVLVLHHVPEPAPNAYEQELQARGVPVERLTLAPDRPLPDWRDFAGIVAMGGPMGVADDARWSWLAGERELIGAAVRAGTPYWGVCLGAQLLAAALGAPVVRGPEPEVGLATISLVPAAAEDPVFAAAPRRFRAFALHQDTFALPAGARLLASSPSYEHQAFAWGAAYGVQFHLEAGPSLTAHWVAKPKYAQLFAERPAAEVRRIVAEVQAHAEPATALARALFGRWLERIVYAGGTERLLTPA